MIASQTVPKTVAVFKAKAVLFDMDGTLTDSIAAVEAAWTAKAHELGLEPEAVIAATHGRRAADNLADLVPGLKKENVEHEVERFEKSILEFADTPPMSRRASVSTTPRSHPSDTSSNLPQTPRTNSFSSGRRGSASLGPSLTMALSRIKSDDEDRDFSAVDDSNLQEEEEELIDMSVRILPGVRKIINALPRDQYAVATSGARTYCHGCLDRTDIKIPNVCVTADDPRLKRGKPHPDPFLLAAKDLGVDPTQTVIFEDSPSGIKAAVAAGGTVIAVCTSHNRNQIENLGAHYIVENMEQVHVEPMEGGQLQFTVTH